MRNKVILARGEEFYLIQTSVRCRSLVRYEGKMALVRAPETFLGPKSRLVLAGSSPHGLLFLPKFTSLFGH